MFLIRQIGKWDMIIAFPRFNPLNQVYVFNNYGKRNQGHCKQAGFNPLNQVYVFNCLFGRSKYYL